MKTINIYYSPKQKSKLTKMCTKYKVSLSTLVDELCYVTYYMIHHYTNEETKQKLTTDYLNKNKQLKTSIKPKQLLQESLSNIVNKKNCFASNCIEIYCEKLITNYLDQEHVNRYYQMLDTRLNEKKESFWNYNNQVRNTARAIRTNKEYYRKILEDA